MVPDFRQPVRDRWTRTNGRRLDHVFDTELRTTRRLLGRAYALHRAAGPRTRSSRFRSWSSLSSDGTYWRACRLPDDAAHPTRSTNLRSGSVCRGCWGGAGVTAGFGAAVRGGSAVTTRTTPK